MKNSYETKIFILFFLLLAVLPSISFAQEQWQIITGMGITLATAILVLLYMIGYGFSINELKILANDEFYQILVTIVIVAGFTGMSASANEISSALGTEYGSSTLQTLAKNIETTNLDNLKTSEVAIRNFANSVSREASKSSFCSFLSVGINIAGCGGYGQLSAPVSLIISAVSLGAAELQSVLILINLGENYALTFLLPLGAFLRSFKITRGAGGLFIALAVTFYFLLPMGVVFMEQLTKAFEDTNDDFKFDNKPALPSNLSCDAFDIDSNEDNEKKVFSDVMQVMDFFIYFVFIKITISTVITIMMMITGLRYVAALTGVDIDVTALARIA